MIDAPLPPLDLDQVLDQITDVDRLRALVRQHRDAMIDQHAFAQHLINDDCKGCARARNECDGSYACTDYHQWHSSYLAALDSF